MATAASQSPALVWSDDEDACRPFIEPASIDGRVWTGARTLRSGAGALPAPTARPRVSSHTAKRANLQLRRELLQRGSHHAGGADSASTLGAAHGASARPPSPPDAARRRRKVTRLRTFFTERTASTAQPVRIEDLPDGTVTVPEVDSVLQRLQRGDVTPHRMVVVSGPAGSGKATAVLRTCAARAAPCVRVVAHSAGEDWVRTTQHTRVPHGGVLLVTGVDGLDPAQWAAYAAASAATCAPDDAPALHPHACVVLVCRSRINLPQDLCKASNVATARFHGDGVGVAAARRAAGLPPAPLNTSLAVDWRRARRAHSDAPMPPTVFAAANGNLLLTGRSVARRIGRAAADKSAVPAGANRNLRAAARVASQRPAVLPMLHAFECVPAAADALAAGDVCAAADWRPGSTGHAIAAELAVRAYTSAVRRGDGMATVPPSEYASASQRQAAARDAAAQLAALHAGAARGAVGGRGLLSTRAAAMETDLMLQAARGVHSSITRHQWPFARYTRDTPRTPT